MPRILLNLLYLDPGRTGGMEVVARDLLPELLRAAPTDWELAAIVNPRAAESDGPWQLMRQHVVDVDVSSRVAWVGAEVLAVPRTARRARADLLHSLGNTGPWRARRPHTVTIHDLIHHRIRGTSVLSYGSRVMTGLVARGATRIIVPATQTKVDLEELLRIPSDRIDVAFNGVAPPTVAAIPDAELRARFDLGDRPFILSPSARQPHKNLDRLMEAHAQLDPSDRPLLVLPGYATGHDDELRRRTDQLGLGTDVRWLGWVEQNQLEALYAGAELLVFPSRYEGFGLPVVEAMLRGLPVACSDRGSLAEVAGDAALIFDPDDTAAIANAVRRLLDDPALCDRLREAGRAQAARFTWQASAEAYVASFAKALSAG